MGFSLPSLVGQMITFGIFVWFTMKFVWPPLTAAMKERQAKIAEGLAAAERGAEDLDKAKQEIETTLRQARDEAAEIIAQANKRNTDMIEQAKTDARAEGDRIIAAAKSEIEQEVAQAREALRAEVGNIAMGGVTKILNREVDSAAHQDIIDELVAQI